jgi:hypothetical protein
LDATAIAELHRIGIATTDDTPKYGYVASGDGADATYSKLKLVIKTILKGFLGIKICKFE